MFDVPKVSVVLTLHFKHSVELHCEQNLHWEQPKDVEFDEFGKMFGNSIPSH